MRAVRGHHLFCMTLFSGHGYDQAFSENMGGLIEALQGGEAFRMVREQDSVCMACPNRREDGGCTLGTENVLRRDSAALEVLGLEEGRELSWEQARERLAAVTQEQFEAVCQKCRWAAEGLCSFGLLREKLGAEGQGSALR